MEEWNEITGHGEGIETMDFNLSEDSRNLKERCKKFCQTKLLELFEQFGETSDVPPAMVKAMAEEGLFRYLIPEEFGGNGIKALSLCLIREELAQVYAPADVTFAMQGLGGYPIVIAGSEEQKRKYLTGIAQGEILTTFALTEPEAGSDVSMLSTWAKRNGDEYTLNGKKKFISNGYAANIAVVFARTQKEGRGITAFILEKGIPGFKVAKRIDLLAPHDIVEFQFEDCRTPRRSIVGVEGEGLQIALRTLDVFRMSVGAAGLGMAQAAFDAALDYSKKRVQFGKPISKFQGISFKIAEMATDLEAARLLVYKAALLKDQESKDISMEASMAKFFATEMAQRVIDQAVQIFGGRGVTKGNPVERLYREVRAIRIYEGTTEIQKLIIGNALLRK
jgi:alkylation response protein AidB-like acyl-CoA dehydrogenase